MIKAETGLREVPLREGKHLLRLHFEHQRPATLVLERVVLHVEPPVSAVLRGPRLGEAVEPTVVGDLDGGALDHYVEPGLPAVDTRREGTSPVVRQVHPLLLTRPRAEMKH